MDEGRVSGLNMEVWERKPGQLLVTSDSDPVRGREPHRKGHSQSSRVQAGADGRVMLQFGKGSQRGFGSPLKWKS